MTLYRITLQICSPLGTPLKGDTIWGHIAWGIANREGDEGISAFLADEKTDAPPLAVSSAFPTGMVCRPLPEPQPREDTLNIEKYSEIKKNKKKKYVPAADYFSFSAGTDGHKTGNQDQDEKKAFETRSVMHNVIDRETNTVLEGGLYAVQEQWHCIKEWDIYVLSSFDTDRIAVLFEGAFENGYGADASIGKGHICIKKNSICTVNPKKQGKTYMALGPFADHPGSGISDIRADIFIRSGKIGGAFAPVLSPYKKTVMLYDEGTVFTSAKPLLYTGRLLENIHQDPRICQAAFAPVVPII